MPLNTSPTQQSRQNRHNRGRGHRRRPPQHQSLRLLLQSLAPHRRDDFQSRREWFQLTTLSTLDSIPVVRRLHIDDFYYHRRLILLRIIADHAATNSAAGGPNGNNGDNNDDNANRPNANNDDDKDNKNNNQLMIFLNAQEDTSFTMTWMPSGADIASSADMGYTYGVYKVVTADTTLTGTYLNVWKKQPDGQWKFVIDSGNAGTEKQGM